MDKKTKRIQTLNDQLRKDGLGGRTVITQGVLSYDKEERQNIYHRVKIFNVFTKDNDPYGEHDFGSFDFRGTLINWKIDYYDPTLTMHSEDKSDPEITVRVLTIMLASEH